MINADRFRTAFAVGLFVGLFVGLSACGGASASHAPAAGAPAEAPEAAYYVYVGAESADLMHRIRFGPEGAEVVRTTVVGFMPTENEAPHGLVASPDERHLYLTTGHGLPDGMLWKYEMGPDTLVADPIFLGNFPASLDVTPDGLYAFIVNFNLHGEMTPSTVSVVYTPEMMEVEQVETCTMPHGVRMHPSGMHAYSVCMMDDQLVELDTRTFQVSRRFSLAEGSEGPIPVRTAVAGHDHDGMDPDVADHRAMDHADHGRTPRPGQGSGMTHDVTCSPTWAQPSVDGTRIYVACNRSDEILEIATEAWTLLRRFPTGRGPYNTEVTPDGRLLVVTLKQGAEVQFFDLESGESVARSETSTTVVHGVAVSPDSRYAFISVEGVGAEPGKVDVFDLATFERIAEVPVGQQASGITFWKMEPLP